MRRAAPLRGTTHIHTGHPDFVIPGSTAVQTFHDLITGYQQQPRESKPTDPMDNPAPPAPAGPSNPDASKPSASHGSAKKPIASPTATPSLATTRVVREYTETPACRDCGALLEKRQRDWCSDKVP
jgi:hypothetical protein